MADPWEIVNRAPVTETSTPGLASPTAAPSPADPGGAGSGTSDPWAIVSRSQSQQTSNQQAPQSPMGAFGVYNPAAGFMGDVSRPAAQPALKATGAGLGMGVAAPALAVTEMVAPDEYRKLETHYQKYRQEQGQQGFDPARLVGEAAPLAFTGAAAEGLNISRGIYQTLRSRGLTARAARTAARALGGGANAAIAGAAAPTETTTGNVYANKAKQTGFNAAAGYILGTLSEGTRQLYQAVAPTFRDVYKRALAGAADINELNEALNSLISRVKDLGLRLTADKAGGTKGKLIEQIGGRVQTEREISAHNIDAVRKAAADDVGINGPLTIKSVDQAIKEELPKYKEITGLGTIPLRNRSRAMAESNPAQTANQKAWQAELDDILGIDRTLGQGAIQPKAPAAVREMVAHYDRDSMTAAEMFSGMQALRDEAKIRFTKGGADDIILARAQRKMAAALENAMERQAIAEGRSDMIGAIANSRKRLAQLYTIRDTMSVTGEIDPHELANRLANGEPLSGNLRTIAEAAQTFDRSFQPSDKIRNHQVSLIGDIGGGLLAATATGHPLAAGVAAVRPGLRKAINNPIYQSQGIGPQIAQPSLAARTAGALGEAARKGQTLKSLKKGARKAPYLTIPITQGNEAYQDQQQ